MKKSEQKNGQFNVVLLGIVFDPEKRKILIGKREKSSDVKRLVWAFPGGKPEYGEEIEDTLKKKIKLKTG